MSAGRRAEAMRRREACQAWFMSDVPKHQRRTAGAGREGRADPNGQIASKLKALYTAVEQEPIPDLFLDLLEQLDRAERASKG